MFLIHINDLPSVFKVLSFYLFADETNICFKSSDIVHLQKVMNREFRKVRKWLGANLPALNIDKTNFVIFHSPQKIILDPVILKIGKKKICSENCVKFLGVLLDSGLSWKHHIAELSKKLARTVGIFYKVRHLIRLETLKMLYYSLFYSFIFYGITVWGLTHKSYLDPIIIAQRKILRVMT